uniref:Solute carrier family 2, facilitated glucose transporter member 5 n=1 Tax=Acanthochromis polyacanthus TaxID=80966 RepID=A0A3Q1GN92_9TELE
MIKCAAITDESDNSFKRHHGERLTLVLGLTTFISTFGSSFQYGYNVAVVNSPSPFMKQFYNTTYMERYDSPMEDGLLTLLWSLSVSMFPLGGFFGSIMVAPLVNKLGRKGTLLFNNIFAIVPAVMMGVSEIAKSYEIIIVARFIVGMCAGLASNVVPMYLSELAPKNLRGAVCIVTELLITTGILLAQTFGIRHILGNSTGTHFHAHEVTFHVPTTNLCDQGAASLGSHTCPLPILPSLQDIII